MTEQQLKLALWQIRKEGFEESFTDYCARTCSSHTYPEEKFAAAKMHGFFLRYFIGAYLDDYFIDAEKLMELAGKAGIVPATLGTRILRCETAPVAAIAVLMNLTNNM